MSCARAARVMHRLASCPRSCHVASGLREAAAQPEKSARGAFNFTPELHLIDGRIVRNIDDAILFLREHEVRPGVDRRDEVMHMLERAETREEVHAAALHFIAWLEELGILG